MAIIEIRIIERESKTYSVYKYTFEVWEDGKAEISEWRHGINHIAECIIQNPIKIQKQMEKFGGMNAKETLSKEYWSRPYTYTYFKTLDEAEKAKDWLDSMIINLTIVGKEELHRQKEQKSIENHEKKVKKALDKMLFFKGKEVIVNIESHNNCNKFVIEGKIDDIQRKNSDLVLNIGKNVICSCYSNFSIKDDKIITIYNMGMNSDFTITLK